MGISMSMCALEGASRVVVMMGSIKQMKGENMTQQPGNPEAALSFFTALVLTIKKIEDERAEPGFREGN